MRYYLFCLQLFIGIQAAYSQSLLPEKVNLQTEDQNIVAYIKPVKREVQTQPDKYYYWYSAGKLRSTQGGFSGKLLNGPYEAFYLNKAIKEQGEFKRGLKNGSWKSWYENGNLKEVSEWRLGNKNGAFSEYDEMGQLKLSGHYHKGKLNGKILHSLSPDSVKVTKYDNGVLVVKKEKDKGKKGKGYFQKVGTKVKGWSKKLLPKKKTDKQPKTSVKKGQS